MNIVITVVVLFVLYRLFFYKPRKEYHIKDINEQSFTLAITKQSKGAPATDEKIIYWKNLKDIRFTSHKNLLSFEDIRNHVFAVPYHAKNWSALLQAVPERFTNFDHEYVKELLLQNEKKTYLKITAATPHLVMYDVSQSSKLSEEAFAWADVKTAQLNEDKTALSIALQNGHTFTIDDDIDNWYWLLKYVPNHFEDADYIKALFESFTACDVCGNIAVLGEECQACYEVIWHKNSVYPTKEKFIKERQLEIFGTDSPLEKIVFKVYEGEAFKKNPDWQLLVTEEEILDFSQENYWQEED
ncbi:hypothetical protein [Microscilla marina]|uniref:Uncharacterized protein n=1 Tax=Microscilla marina ATCC 23134 TaxID=313606 RepID=A1ZSA7_MICM2|nr:hypothetical protein [Microscilla marina]EAY26655.1 hypothetical protein M23134_02906 [Microscilla marina ATCC 23134]